MICLNVCCVCVRVLGVWVFVDLCVCVCVLGEVVVFALDVIGSAGRWVKAKRVLTSVVWMHLCTTVQNSLSRARAHTHTHKHTHFPRQIGMETRQTLES